MIFCSKKNIFLNENLMLNLEKMTKKIYFNCIILVTPI